VLDATASKPGALEGEPPNEGLFGTYTISLAYKLLLMTNRYISGQIKPLPQQNWTFMIRLRFKLIEWFDSVRPG
jgi:hypothetical protein